MNMHMNEAEKYLYISRSLARSTSSFYVYVVWCWMCWNARVLLYMHKHVHGRNLHSCILCFASLSFDCSRHFAKVLDAYHIKIYIYTNTLQPPVYAATNVFRIIRHCLHLPSSKTHKHVRVILKCDNWNVGIHQIWRCFNEKHLDGDTRFTICMCEIF